jgi:glutamate/aspartate transport system ATP-binding protein
MSAEPVIRIERVDKWYTPGTLVLRDVSLTIARGEVVVVCGPSGSGKSTLIKCVNALEPIQRGRIAVDGIALDGKGVDLPRLRARVGMVFQHFELFPHMRVMDNLCLAQCKVLGRSREEAAVRAAALLERVGLTAHAAKYPGQLSGGQQQRVGIARAIVTDPTIIVADEPTGDLDARSAEDILNLLVALQKSLHKTILMVTHDPRAASRAARVLHLDKGRLVRESGVESSEMVFKGIEGV